MENAITSEPSAKTTRKASKRKMSVDQRKALSAAAKARWAAKKAGAVASSIVAAEPATVVPQASPQPPSPAVLQLQEQVVGLVAQRNEARRELSSTHTAYLMAQGAFQAAEAKVKAAEQDAQYLLGLIAQLENRAASSPAYAPAPVLQMPSSLAGVTSEPSPVPATQQTGTYAMASVDDELRRRMRGMM